MLITESTELLEDVIVCATIETVLSITAATRVCGFREYSQRACHFYISRTFFSNKFMCGPIFILCSHFVVAFLPLFWMNIEHIFQT